jgi:hypothetical protein
MLRQFLSVWIAMEYCSATCFSFNAFAMTPPPLRVFTLLFN